MCLDVITKKYHKNLNEERVGWKVFHKDNRGKLFSIQQGIVRSYKIDEWVNEKKYADDYATGYIYTYDKYRRGFHVFRTRKDARIYRKDTMRGVVQGCVVKKVLYKNITAEGIQNIYIGLFNTDVAKVDVAKDMKILK